MQGGSEFKGNALTSHSSTTTKAKRRSRIHIFESVFFLNLPESRSALFPI